MKQASLNFLKNMYSEGRITNKELIDTQNDSLINSVTGGETLEDPFIHGYYQILQEISYRCSGQCPYCMNRGLDYSETEAPVEDYIAFYDKIIAQGGTIRLQITGGEPLQPGVIERTSKLVKYAQEHDEVVMLQINSNGNWEIPDDWACDKLLMQFSMDGDKEYVENITKIDGLYDNLIANFEKCHKLGIKFQTKTVINPDNEKFVPDIVKIVNQYGMIAKMQWTLPVGGASNENEKNDLLTMLQKTKEYENKYNIEGQVKEGGVRGCIGYCFRVYKQVDEENPVIPMLITPCGKIGLCAFLATKYMPEGFTIYDFDLINPYTKFIKYLRDTLKDVTCSFPNGFINFYNSLTDKEKESIEYFINEPDYGNGGITLKEFYNL